MKLIDIYDHRQGAAIAYELLKQRPLEHGISHKRMPTYAEHLQFMHSHAFRFWFVIETEDIMDPMLPFVAVGAIEALATNEFGVHILSNHQGLGYGKRAASMFIEQYAPLPAIPAIRNGHWLANVAPANTRAGQFFKALGFHLIQETYEL